ncbi:unnamed protein product [Vicia faba]|uniref:Uncharacterized protein n=1 Tax=Vicia faba TaxID=3906 RepID=A0AAV0Z6G4_VICFA|nr:unnamed protein product [Vicia faba]
MLRQLPHRSVGPSIMTHLNIHNNLQSVRPATSFHHQQHLFLHCYKWCGYPCLRIASIWHFWSCACLGAGDDWKSFRRPPRMCLQFRVTLSPLSWLVTGINPQSVVHR